MDDAINLVFADDAFDFVVIADISFDQRDIDVVLGAQVRDAVFKALVERVVDDNRFAGADEFICNMCTDVASTACKKPCLLGHAPTITRKMGVN